MNNQPDDDIGQTGLRRLGRGLQSRALSIGDGEIVVMLSEDVSQARDLFDTMLSSGEGASGQVPEMIRRAHVDPLLTVRGNLEVPLRRAGVEAATARQQIPMVAALLGLLDTLDTRAMTLTARQRERVRLALEAFRPTALLVPGNFAQLPEDDGRRLRSKILELRRILGGRLLLVDEIMDDVRLGADRVAVVDNEEVRQVGTPRHVYERPVDLYTAARFGRHSLMLAEAQSAGRSLVTPLGRVRLPGNVPDLVHQRELLVGLRPDALSTDTGSHDMLRLPVRVTGTPTPERPGEVDQDWSRSFVLPAAALRAGLAARVAGVPLRHDASMGQQVRLSADPGRLMLFDASTGENILGDHVLADFGDVTAETIPPVVMIGRDDIPPASPPESGTPTAAPEAPPRRVRRFLKCDHPPTVQRGSDFVIRAQVTVQGGTGGRAFETDPIPAQGVDLLLVVYADRFVARTDATIPLKLPRAGDSEVAAFVLAAPGKTGKYRLLIRVFRGNAQLAEQPLTIEVSENPTAPSGEPTAWLLANAVPRPHVVRLIITRSGRKYQYVLASDDTSEPSRCLSKSVGKSPDGQLRALVRRLNDMAAGKGYSPTEIRETLRAQGQELWQNFIPGELAGDLQDLDTERSILWISTFGESEKVPWEMLHPIEKISGRDDFLGRIFPTVRSPTGPTGLADELLMRRAEIVLPDPSLAGAAAEVSDIRHILDGRADVGADICEKAQLREVLKGGEFSLLHMVGHSDNRKSAGLILAAGQRLEPG